MDTLAWVVKQYMTKKKSYEPPCRRDYIKDDYYDEEVIEEKIEELKIKEWTIDLR